MTLRIYIDSVEEVPGNESGIELGAVGSVATLALKCDEGYQTAEQVTVNAPTDCEVSRDGVTYAATAVFAAGDIADEDVTVYVKRTAMTVTEDTWTGGTLTPRLALVTTEAIPVPNRAPVFDSGPSVGSITSDGCTVSATYSDPDDDEITATYRVVASEGTPDWDGAPSFTSPQAVSGLDPETAYDVYVRLDDGEGEVVVSDAVPFETLAEAPVDFARYKTVNLTGQSGAGTNYQVRLVIAKGADDGTSDFGLDSNVQNWPYDIEFRATNGTTVYPYWRESSDANYVTVWVKVGADLSSNASMRCYYDLAAAPDTSNGDDTFIFFDDFPGSSLDTDKWDVLESVTSVSGSEARFNGGTSPRPHILGKVASASGIAQRVKVRSVGSNTDNLNGARLNALTGASYTADSASLIGTVDNNEARLTTWRDPNYEQTAAVGLSTYSSGLTTEIRWVSASCAAVETSPASRSIATHTTRVPTGDMKAWLLASSTENNDIAVDWVLVRKYQVAEPTFASVG